MRSRRCRSQNSRHFLVGFFLPKVRFAELFLRDAQGRWDYRFEHVLSASISIALEVVKSLALLGLLRSCHPLWFRPLRRNLAYLEVTIYTFKLINLISLFLIPIFDCSRWGTQKHCCSAEVPTGV